MGNKAWHIICERKVFIAGVQGIDRATLAAWPSTAFLKSLGPQQISGQEAPTITRLHTEQQPRAFKASTRFPRSQLYINCHISFHIFNVHRPQKA